MTYDDLVANISSPNYMKSRSLDSAYAVIRAVVELHGPYRESWDHDDRCKSCEGDGGAYLYPCPTIKAILKELT